MDKIAFYNGVFMPQTKTDSRLLAANVPKDFTVPTDPDTGVRPKRVIFGSPVAADFYAQMFDADTGGERVTNGNFTNLVLTPDFAEDENWDKGEAWAIGSGVASIDGSQESASAISQEIAGLVHGRTYTLTVTVTRDAGSITPSLGGEDGTARSTADTFTEEIVAGSDGILAFTASDDFEGTIDDIILTAWEYGDDWADGGGVATASTSSGVLSQNAFVNRIVQGQAYLVTFTATRTAGSVTVSIGGTAGTPRSTADTFTEVIIAGSTQDIAFTGDGFSGTIDNVTVKAAAKVPADNSTGSSSVQNPEGFLIPDDVDRISIVSGGTPVITASYFK
jgi:hypothetical protein